MYFEATFVLVFFIGFVLIIGILIYNSEQSFRERNESLNRLRNQAILDRPLPSMLYMLEDLMKEEQTKKPTKKKQTKKPTKKKPTKKKPTKNKVLSTKKKLGTKRNQ